MIKRIFVALVLGWSAEAFACRCLGPPAIFFPKNGSVGVPTNAQFLLNGSAEFGAFTITLTGPGNVVVGTFTPTGTQRMASPVPLEPNTVYTLAAMGDRTPSTFTTGAGPDLTPPVLVDFEFDSFGSPILKNPCGNSEIIVFKPNASDDVTPTDQLHYDFFFGPTPSSVDLVTARQTLGDAMIAEGSCTSNNFPMFVNSRIAGALTAIDWAGNRSVQSSARPLKGCGCASGSNFLSLTALGLLLLASRRRRSS